MSGFPRKIPAGGWPAVVISAAAGVAGALLIITLVSLSPIRFDVKAYRNAIPEVSARDLDGMRAVVLVSSHDTWPMSQFSEYGLEAITFPDRTSAWIVFAEGYTEGPLRPSWLVAQDGGIRASSGESWRLSGTEEIEQQTGPASTTLLIVDSNETGRELVRRVPRFAGARVVALSATRSRMLEGPRFRGSLAMFCRLSLMLFALAGTALALVARGRSRVERVAFGLYALPLLVAVHGSLAYLSSWFWTHSVTLAAGIEAIVVTALLLRSSADPIPLLEPGPRTRTLFVVCTGIAVFGAVSVLRLDYDGDLFTHWLPAARSFHARGGHDLGFLLERFGVAHESAYPPAFPISIATTMWLSGTAPHGPSSIFSPASHAQVLLYRILLTSMNIAFLSAFVLSARRVTNASWGACGMLALFLCTLLPQFAGKPASSETLLVPFVGLAIAALSIGTAGSDLLERDLGMFLAGSTLLFKNECVLIVPFVILPWAIGSRQQRRFGRAFLAFALGSIAFAVWRFQQAAWGVDSNFMFHPLSWSTWVARSDLLPSVVAAAVRALLTNGFWLIPLVAIITVLATPNRAGNRNLAAIVGATFYIVGTAVMFVFSGSDVVHHTMTAYDRLASHAIVSMVLSVWLILGLSKSNGKN